MNVCACVYVQCVCVCHDRHQCVCVCVCVCVVIGTSGRAVFSNVTRKGFYTVKATVVTGTESASITRRVRLDPDNAACSAHLINTGLGFRTGGIVAAEFASVGPSDTLICTLDGVVVSDPCELLLVCMRNILYQIIASGNVIF